MLSKKQLTIKQKIIASFLIIAILFTLNSIITNQILTKSTEKVIDAKDQNLELEHYTLEITKFFTITKSYLLVKETNTQAVSSLQLTWEKSLYDLLQHTEDIKKSTIRPDEISLIEHNIQRGIQNSETIIALQTEKKLTTSPDKLKVIYDKENILLESLDLNEYELIQALELIEKSTQTNLETQLSNQRIVRNTSYAILFITLLLAMLFPLLLSKSLFRSLNLLSAGAKKISKGDFKTKINLNSKDELGLLAETFNQMAADLKNKFELENRSTSLEKEVLKRSKELEKKVIQLEKFQKLLIGRELKMVELKNEIKKLKKHLN